MRRAQPFRSLPIALFAIVLAASGLAAALCVAMADCPMRVPASDCQAASGVERHCAPPRLEASDDCCALTAAEPAAVPASEAPTPLIVEAEPAGLAMVLVAPHSPPAEGAALAVRPAGRALLSLHHTLLI